MEAEYIKMNLGGYLDLLDKLERSRTTMEDCSAVADALLANVALMCRADSIFQFTVPVLQN